MNKEYKSIQHSLSWMPEGTFNSFSAASGSGYSYTGEDKVILLFKGLGKDRTHFFLNLQTSNGIVDEGSFYGGSM